MKALLQFSELGRTFGLVLAIVVLGSGFAVAQLTTATLTGTVSDSTGAAIPKAKISIVKVDTNYVKDVISDGTGSYRADLLPIGKYTITVEAPGFEKFVQQNLTLSINDQARVDVKLAVGGTSQQVTVIDAPPAVNLENATVGRTIHTNEVEDLPILDRNIYNLLPLVPGVQTQSNGNTLGYPQEIVQINGSTTENNTGAVSYYLDGGLNMTALRMTGNQMPNPEALAEFNVQTSNYSAVYGRLSSGVISAVTKSGTNQFHGSVYEFHRETNFNSNAWVDPTRAHGPITRSPVHRHFFGGVVGGPVIKDRTFFFFDYSGFRDIAPKSFTGAAVLPTAKEIKGDFSDYLPAAAVTSCNQTLSAADKANGAFIVCNPTTRLPYAGNVITDPLDPVAQNIVRSLPAANAGTTLAPSYVGSVPLPSTYNEYMGKVDHQLTSKQRLFASFFSLKGKNTVFAGSGNMPWGLQEQDYTLDVANLSDTMTISSNKVNQVWVTYTRSFGGRINGPAKSLSDFGSSFAIQGQPSLPNVTVTNYFTLSNAIQGPVSGTNFYSFRDLFILNKGKHNLQMGGEASLNKDIQLTLLNNFGVFAFAASTSARTGNALSDYMLGLLNTESQEAPVTSIANSFFYAGFLQDDWRITPRLTLNLGLRWDLQTPPTDPQNKASTFVLGQQSTVNPLMPLGEVVVGDKGITRGITPTYFDHVSPRVGLAWDVFGDGKTSARLGAGLFWGAVSGNEWTGTSNSYPFTLRYTFPVPGTLVSPYKNSPSPFPFTYTAGKVGAIPVGGSISGIAPDFRWPYTYQMNVSVQQQMAHSLVVGVAFVSSLARKLVFSTDKNYPVFNTANPASNLTTNILQRRPIDTGILGGITSTQSHQTSNYNAMQVTFVKQMSHGISFNGYYAWTKTMESVGLEGTFYQDLNNLKLEKGPSNSDQRNIFVTSVVWQPDYVHHNRFLGAALNHWKVSPIIKLYSGSPFSITTGVDSNNDGLSADRAIPIGLPYAGVDHSSRAAEINNYFNRTAGAGASFCAYVETNPSACLGTGPAGSDGTTGRNAYYGPPTRLVDLALLRDFPIHENIKFQLRGEASNVFNFVNLSNPNGAINLASTTHQITSAGGMRQIQVGGRLTF